MVYHCDSHCLNWALSLTPLALADVAYFTLDSPVKPQTVLGYVSAAPQRGNSISVVPESSGDGLQRIKCGTLLSGWPWL